MPLNCPQAVSKLKAYKQQHQDLKKQFSDFMSQFPYLPDIKTDEPFMQSPHYQILTDSPKDVFHNLYDAKQEAKKQLAELESLSINSVLFFKQANNPYYEKIDEDGMVLPNFDRQKLKNYKLDLNQVLYTDRKSFSEDFDLDDVLPKTFSELGLSIRQMKSLEKRIALGEIPIFMPGREVQLDDLHQLISQAFIPIVEHGNKMYLARRQGNSIESRRFDNFIELMAEVSDMLLENKKRKTINGGLLSDAQIEKLQTILAPLGAWKNDLETIKNLIKAINSIPDRPYVFTVSTKEVTKFKNIEALRQAINNSNQETGAIGMVEYICFQKIFAERIMALAKAHNKKFDNLDPLDYNEGVYFADLSNIGIDGYYGLDFSGNSFYLEELPLLRLSEPPKVRFVTRFYSNKK